MCVLLNSFEVHSIEGLSKVQIQSNPIASEPAGLLLIILSGFRKMKSEVLAVKI